MAENHKTADNSSVSIKNWGSSVIFNVASSKGQNVSLVAGSSLLPAWDYEKWKDSRKQNTRRLLGKRMGGKASKGREAVGNHCFKGHFKIIGFKSYHYNVTEAWFTTSWGQACKSTGWSLAVFCIYFCLLSGVSKCPLLFYFILFQTALRAEPCPPLKKYMRRVSAHIPLMMLTCTMGNCAHLTQSKCR